MLRAGRNIARLVAIVWTLARHDALYPLEVAGFELIAKVLRHLAARGPVEGRVGQRLAAALHALGPSFIKLGQALSTRPDVVGEAIADDLANLQDRLPPSPGTEARLIVEDELGAPIEHLFADFEDYAVAAASIAQVHHATTSDGRRISARAIASRCRCPPDNDTPRSPTIVSYPSGISPINPSACAARAIVRTSSIPAFGLPIKIFAATVS